MTLRYRLHLLRPRYMKIRAMRVVCLVRGHRYGDIATRLLGVCDRCHFPYDPPAPTEGSDPYDRAAKALLDWVEKRDALTRRQFSAADVTAMRKTLVKYGATDKAGDYAAAEQIVLGLESLSYSLGDRDKKKAALDALYNAVKNDTAFSPQQFASAAANAQRAF